MKRLLFAVCLVSGCQNEITPRHERHSDIKQYGKLATPYVWDESIAHSPPFSIKRKNVRHSQKKIYFQARPTMKATRAINAIEGTKAIESRELTPDQ